MIIEVIPFDFSIDDEWFSYFVNDDFSKQISVWSIVEIPFKNLVTLAIVSKMNILYDKTIEIKSIVSVICSAPILSEYQIKTIYNISSKYFVHIHKVLAIFLPKFIYNLLEKKSFLDLEKPKIDKNNHKKDKKLMYCSKNDNFSEITNIITQSKSCVIVFPDDFMLDDFFDKFLDLEQKSIVYKNSFSYAKKYKAFINVYNKTKNIIIWTRKILQYNLQAYEKIIYIEDIFTKFLYSYNHKYKNLDLLEYFYENGDFEINIISKIPSLELIFKTSKKEYKLENN